MNPAEMIAKLEAAPEGSHELDVAIARTMPDVYWTFGPPPKPWTTSLNAAMALWCTPIVDGHVGRGVNLWYDFKPGGKLYRRAVAWEGKFGGGVRHCEPGNHRDAVIATCIAALNGLAGRIRNLLVRDRRGRQKRVMLKVWQGANRRQPDAPADRRGARQ